VGVAIHELLRRIEGYSREGGLRELFHVALVCAVDEQRSLEAVTHAVHGVVGGEGVLRTSCTSEV